MGFTVDILMAPLIHYFIGYASLFFFMFKSIEYILVLHLQVDCDPFVGEIMVMLLLNALWLLVVFWIFTSYCFKKH